MNLSEVALATAVAAAFSLPAVAKEFRSADIHPDDYPTVLAVRHMGETLSKATNGKHSIKVFSKSALKGIEKDTIEQTKLGAIAMTRVNAAPMNNICASHHGADHAFPVPLHRTHAQGAGRRDW